MPPELIGYTDRLSAAPGESIRFMVSTDHPAYHASIVRLIHGDENPAGPGFKEEVIETAINREYTGRKQIAHSGSYVIVENSTPLAQPKDLTIQLFCYPTTPQHVQGLLTKWSPADGSGYGLYIGEGGDLELWLGNGAGLVERIHTGRPLRSHQWYFVAATYSAATSEVCLYQIPLANWAVDDSRAILETPVQIQHIGVNTSPLLIGAAYADTSRAVWGLYNGKIDSPCVFARDLSTTEIEALRQGTSSAKVAGDALLAAWDFAAEFASTKVTDSGPHQIHGTAINMPMRAVTGHNWNSTEFDFKHAPQQYGAIYFHEDDLDDAGWDSDFEWTIPDGLRSGIYAARLRSGEQEDHIPFVVRPRKGTTTAPVLFLLPTMTYLAYANDRMRGFEEEIAWVNSRKIEPDPLDVYLAEHPEFAASLYDIHADGSGYCYSSRLRPIMGLRPKFRFWIVGTPRHLAADLYMIDWLEQKGFDYDVVTDEDLHVDGETLLSNYKTVITGTHPEYWTTPMLTALESYLAGGGKLMYMGGNGFYWVTSVDPERPHLIEVRRGISGTRAWNSAPGETYHSTTGELGGLWRHRGKAPNQLVGVGFTAQGWNGRAPGYFRKPGSFDERAAFIFDGIGADEEIGNFGLVLGGAAGDELDRADEALGTPPHTLLLASSAGHDPLILPVIEDFAGIDGGLMTGQISTVHADLVYFETPNDGAVFATGSITWCGSLSHNHYHNNVSRITENVLREFLK